MDLDEAIARADQEDYPSTVEYLALLPQTVSRVLAMEGAIPGATVGSWAIAEDDEYHRGFQMTFEGPPIGLPQFSEVLQIEPDYFLVSISHMSGELVQAELDFSGAEGPTQLMDIPEYTTNGEMQALLTQLTRLAVLVPAHLLAEDLFNFITDRPVTDHFAQAEEYRMALLSQMEDMDDTEEIPRKPKRRRRSE